MSFLDKLCNAARQNKSWLCIGLDSELSKLPTFLRERHGPYAVLEFNRAIIEVTADLVCAYKPNLAFYEMLGPVGLEILYRTRELIPKEIPIIGDAKRGDIENTARAYAQALFEYYRFDAVTVNPLMGFDSVAPFLEYLDKCTFLLVRTSNPGARDFQELSCDGRPFYQRLAEKACEWNTRKNVGVVVGATAPDQAATVRQIVGDEMPILVPGVGAQAGDLERAVKNSVNAQGELAIINVSRSVLFASQSEDFAQAARKAAQILRDAINRWRV
ncbi:MAG: orotidine-5'-phosphate decarboxylase [Candidatus Bipolaricaulota bacterium]|nr:orotidine-5'-phosphate decarboxylase [Candidatus Bipolaricaulota bacterium]MDW8030389.1 orotidine-5'-phosphate decarboxylase [Candidatus Bipolaricaulota bacterium]